jgi:hypothetical protein
MHDARRAARAKERVMVWLLLESLVAGAILVAIVWWTMRPARRRDRDGDQNR